ncbi:putative ubiquitinyl hydrolase 1 [Helianthus annuus]|uniref:Ubiquitin carboxyl-terminal hydrolase n=1 Tax=Helianthus annuus TaxID=4232 RepID=A0A251SI20_HELAN|nr:ubiquitin carboxyl-terminal hydrolase 27 [Helianthus annuus]KAF5769440.1 putative ubiquitinyl hydrolase 1 [Helianthus annuus]KAJ0464467.1 putative ubiquitinyl hydrolase 1 [Helianthus annuus]KAJ0469021.1 putative ubiquitinyl hydrolase 1 [Helianthus annuus]KAJ0486045.1 putative ubiquitinyl hydrolase 1 [Helianthus annuus]KAJ0656599.1 putative ubiquitinyl hydrolase 1 [Helianthus annuus]
MKIQGDVKLQSLFHSFKHGFRTISHNAHWVTSSGFQISLASSIISVAGLILALKDGRGRRGFNNLLLSWSASSETESSPEKRLPVVSGLQNLGNNCFLNVVLQALASCSCFLNSLQKIVEEFEGSSEGEQIGDMPLAVSLNDLLQELCIVRHEHKVLSPRKVMLAMSHYTPNFNLTSQQDAEEALAHMLSSLREECSEYFPTNHSSLAVATASSNRFITVEKRVIFSELERWTQRYLGPFNGIIGSILTCKSCSFQISLDFQFFNCLYLSPPTYGGGSIMPGCSIEDCLKRFFVAERIENYFCTHCWHATALKYLSLLNKNETDIETLQSCSKQDTCDCKDLPSLGSLPWSNSYSQTFKQLHIARTPKILCLNLQRASMNVFGESIKLRGHLSFPLTLDMSPFQNKGVEIKHSEQKLPFGRLVQQNQQPIRFSDFLRLQTDKFTLDNIYKQPPLEDPGDREIQEEQYIATHQDSEVREGWNLNPNGHHIYNLVSVVEHFGNAGGGHYTVYRRVITEIKNSENDHCHVCWVGVSDSQVYRVSEEDVLGAEATLLFYEKVSESS